MAEPMYRQIADDLRHKIETGELKRGSQLPSETDLRVLYHASRNTVRDSIRWLTTRGLVETRPGQGTFVTERITPVITTLTGAPEIGGDDSSVYIAEVVASSRAPEISHPKVELQRATGIVARALDIDEGTQVVSRHQQRFIDGTPWSLQTSFYPMTLVERGATDLIQARDSYGGTVAYLAAKCGIKQAGHRDTIAVRAPDDNEASFFKLPADGRVSVFEIFRVDFDNEGNPFRLTVTIYPADRNQLWVEVGELPTREQPAHNTDDRRNDP